MCLDYQDWADVWRRADSEYFVRDTEEPDPSADAYPANILQIDRQSAGPQHLAAPLPKFLVAPLPKQFERPLGAICALRVDAPLPRPLSTRGQSAK